MATSNVRNKIEEIRFDTVREQVMVVVFDTIREVTTITVQQNEVGDTLRSTTLTDRTRTSTRDRYHDVQEKVIIKTDTVYIEKEIEKQISVTGNSQPNYIKFLKWLFFLIISLTLFLLVLKLYKL